MRRVFAYVVKPLREPGWQMPIKPGVMHRQGAVPYAQHYQGPYMDSSSLQASFALAPVPTAHVYSASDFGIDSMQGHDGLFARRLPIGSTCFAHLDT